MYHCEEQEIKNPCEDPSNSSNYTYTKLINNYYTPQIASPIHTLIKKNQENWALLVCECEEQECKIHVNTQFIQLQQSSRIEYEILLRAT